MNDETDRHNASEGGHPLLWIITAILLFALIAVAGYKYREHARSTVIATAPLDPGCLLNTRRCTAALPNGSSASLAIAPHPIVVATPMQLSLSLEGIEARQVEIHFRGEEMDMGLSQYILTQQGGGEFSGEAILPVCVRNSMFWIADVLVVTPQGKFIFPFRFETVHP